MPEDLLGDRYRKGVDSVNLACLSAFVGAQQFGLSIQFSDGGDNFASNCLAGLQEGSMTGMGRTLLENTVVTSFSRMGL